MASGILEEFDECYYDYPSFVTMFSLHEDQVTEEFQKHWTFWDYPVDKISDYFGEQLGLYFAFSRHYVLW